jgi:hypothetical protein
MGLDEREQITVQTQPDWEVEVTEGQVENPWFRFGAEAVEEQGRVDVNYRLEVLRPQVAPDELRAYRAEVQRVDDLRGIAVLHGERPFPVTWPMVEKVIGFFATVFAVLVAVPASVAAAAVFIFIGMPRRRRKAL